jgi:hypothetical protein
MHKRSKLLLVGLAAAMLLSMAVGNASARNLSLNEQSFRAVWTPLEFVAGGNTVKCNVTLEGSFHYRTIVKRADALIGFITRAIANTCTGGSATVLTATLPWHLPYEGFSGTLPNITDIRIKLVGASFNVFPTGAPRACLARTTTANPARGIANVGAGGRVTNLQAEPGASIPLEEFFCAFAGEGRFIGTTSSLTKLGGGDLFVRLI